MATARASFSRAGLFLFDPDLAPSRRFLDVVDLPALSNFVESWNSEVFGYSALVEEPFSKWWGGTSARQKL